MPVGKPKITQLSTNGVPGRRYGSFDDKDFQQGLIDGELTYVLSNENEAVGILSDGFNYWVIAAYLETP